MTTNNVSYQLAPKVKYSCNSSKKAIQTWKHNFLSGMASTQLDFPLSKWCKILEKGNIILNLLCPSRLNPNISAYAQVFVTFDHQITTLTPNGMKVLAHVLTIYRCSFDTHVIKGFYVGVTM